MLAEKAADHVRGAALLPGRYRTTALRAGRARSDDRVAEAAAFAALCRSQRWTPPIGGCASGVYRIFVGYAATTSSQQPRARDPRHLREHPQYTKRARRRAHRLSIAYGLSKFLMGSVSDKSNPKYFLPSACSCRARSWLRSASSRRPARPVRHRRNPGAERLGSGMGWPRAARPWCTGSVPRSAAHSVSVEHGAQHRRGALANFALVGVMLFHDCGRSSTSTHSSPRWRSRRFPAPGHTAIARLPAVEQYKNDYPPAIRKPTSTRSVPGNLFQVRLPNATCGRSRRQRVLLLCPYGVVNWIRRIFRPPRLLVPAVERRLVVYEYAAVPELSPAVGFPTSGSR